MSKKYVSMLMVLALLLVTALAACGGDTEIGSEENPIVMSFVPSGDTQEIIASGEELAEMLAEAPG